MMKLSQLAAIQTIKNHSLYSEEELSGINPDFVETFLVFVRNHKTLKRFMHIFGVSNQEEMLQRLTWVRWDASRENTTDKNYRYRGFKKSRVSSICIVPQGIAIGTDSGCLSVYYGGKELRLWTADGNKISMIHYYNNKLFVVRCNWKIEVFVDEIDSDGHHNWNLTIEYVDPVASVNWVRNVMCRGRFMMHVENRNVNLYELTDDEARVVWTSPFQNGLYIKCANMTENHVALIMSNAHGGFGQIQVVDNLVLVRLDSLRVSINIPLDQDMMPIQVILDENEDRNGWVYVAYGGCHGMRNCIEQYAYGYVLDIESESSSVLSVAPVDRIECGELDEQLHSIACHKDKITALFSKKEDKTVVARVYVTSPFKLVREFVLNDFYNDPPSIKKRRVMVNYTNRSIGPEGAYGMDMDASRLVCYDNKSQRIHCWDFSE
jgi:hypothetical protein